jgi:hypothetical protein
MGQKSPTQALKDSIQGEHLALAVAAHLARVQLVPNALAVYDGQHLSAMLDTIGNALVRVAPVYVLDPAAGERRALNDAEVLGARVEHSARILVLQDGRRLAGVSIKRADLRQAIAILKPAGLGGMAARAGSGEKSQTGKDATSLMDRFRELEALLTPPLIPAQVERAKKLAVSIARSAPHGPVANRAMQLISALEASKGTDDTPGGFSMALARLGAALTGGQDADK